MNRLITAIVGSVSGALGFGILWWFWAANVHVEDIPDPKVCVSVGAILGFVSAFIVKEEDLLSP